MSSFVLVRMIGSQENGAQRVGITGFRADERGSVSGVCCNPSSSDKAKSAFASSSPRIGHVLALGVNKRRVAN